MRRTGWWVIMLGCLLAAIPPVSAVMPAGLQLERVLTPKEGLSHPVVLSLAIGPEHVYIGTRKYLNVLKKDGTITHWTPENSKLKFLMIPAMAVRGHELWTTCRSPVAGGGTYRWDGLQWEWFEEIKDDMQSNYVSCFHVDDKNVLWIGTEDQGLNYYVHETNPFRKFGYLATKKGIVSNQIMCLTSRPGELWIGTVAGISVYRGQEGDRALVTNYTLTSGLPADRITALAATPERVYAGSTLGLQIFENGSWRLLGKEAGLADAWISALVVDGSDLWIGTAKGLQVMRGGRIEPPIDHRDGLPAHQIRCLAIGRGPDGVTRLYVGTERGLAIFKRL